MRWLRQLQTPGTVRMLISIGQLIVEIIRLFQS